MLKLRAIFFTLMGLFFFAVPSWSQTKNFRFEETINIDGLSRSYLVNLPPNYYDSTNFALVIALHGGGGNGQNFERSTGLTEEANSQHFIVVYPDGYLGPGKQRTWNAGTCCGAAMRKKINDVKFIRNLIEKLLSEYQINPRKIYVVGHSNGGMMAYRLANELSDEIAAIAVSSCSSMITDEIHPKKIVPILHFHSIRDQHVPFSGGVGIIGYDFPSVDSVLTDWAKADSCELQPKVSTYPNYTVKKWVNKNQKVMICLYLTKDGGHSWPGGNHVNPRSDEPSKAINANELLWNFFRQFQLPE